MPRKLQPRFYKKKPPHVAVLSFVHISPLLVVKQVVEGGLSCLLEKGAELHIASDTEVHPIPILNRRDEGVGTLPAKRTVLVARTVSLHALCVWCCHFVKLCITHICPRRLSYDEKVP